MRLFVIEVCTLTPTRPVCRVSSIARLEFLHQLCCLRFFITVGDKIFSGDRGIPNTRLILRDSQANDHVCFNRRFVIGYWFLLWISSTLRTTGFRAILLRNTTLTISIWYSFLSLVEQLYHDKIWQRKTSFFLSPWSVTQWRRSHFSFRVCFFCFTLV